MINEPYLYSRETVSGKSVSSGLWVCSPPAQSDSLSPAAAPRCSLLLLFLPSVRFAVCNVIESDGGFRGFRGFNTNDLRKQFQQD